MTKELAIRPKRSVARTLTAPARGLKALSTMVFRRGGGLVWRFLPRTRFDYRREVGDGMGSSVIMAPILWMARTFPEAPIRVLDGDGVPVDRHPMVALLRRPNRFYSGVAMWWGLIISLVLDGNGYLLKVRNKAGTGVIELWYVPHWMIEPKSDDEDTFIEHYDYSPNGVAIRVEVENVVHLRYGLDPADTRKGLSPLASVLREVFSDDEAANFAASLLRNMGVPGVVISPHPNSPPPASNDVEAVKDHVGKMRGDNRGEPLVMSGAVEVNAFGFNPQQMDLKALRRVPEERTTAVLGTPAIVVGLGAGLDRSTFANFAEAREAAYESNIIPLHVLVDEDLRNQLLPDFEDDPDSFEVDHDYSGVRVLQADRGEEATRLATLFDAGLITRAYALEQLGEEATDADQVYKIALAMMLVPVGEMPADQAPDEPTAPATDEASGSGSGSGDEQEPPAKRRKARHRHKAVTEPTLMQSRVVEAQNRIGDVLVTVLTEELEADFTALGDAAYDAYIAETAQKAVVDAEDEALVTRILNRIGASTWAQKILKGRLEAHARRTVAETSRTIREVAGLPVLIPSEVEQRIVTAGGKRAGLVDIEAQTRDAIMGAIKDGRAEAEGPVKIADRIKAMVPAGPFPHAGAKYRANLIARTETKHAQNVSSLEVYRASPVVTKVRASDGLGPGDTDAECEARNGQEMSFDEAEIAIAETHPACTLTFAPVTVVDVFAAFDAAA